MKLVIEIVLAIVHRFKQIFTQIIVRLDSRQTKRDTDLIKNQYGIHIELLSMNIKLIVIPISLANLDRFFLMIFIKQLIRELQPAWKLLLL